MYMDKVIEISKAANGFVVSCCVPLKPEAKSSGKMEMSCCSGQSVNKQYIAKDEKEVCDIMEDLIPLLDADYKSEADFDKAFEEATNEMSAEEKGEDS